MRAEKGFIALALILFVWAPAIAQDHQHGGGEKLGDVHFATSCNESAQREFDRALALLHSFQFATAIDGFQSAIGADSTCAIAYWGLALSDWGNPFAPGMKNAAQLRLGRENVERGERLGAKSAREQAYVVAAGKLYDNFEGTPQRARMLAYRDAMEELARKYPDDQEAQIFYALALAFAADLADKTYADQLKAGAILERLFAQQPMHPGLAHYIIHAYDVPALAGRASTAARRYAQIAPDAPHALHMPSHTFTRIGLWQESIDSNVAAAEAARRQGQVPEELHASDYEVYAYLQSGQDHAAAQVVNSLPEIAARFNPKALLAGAGPPAAGYFALAAIPARYALERQNWEEARRLSLQESPFAYADAMTWFAKGMGAARLGQRAEADDAAAALQGLQDRLAKSKETYWARQVEIQATELEAWSTFDAGTRDDGIRLMESAVGMEDATEKSAVTPGPLSSAHELLGEMYLRVKAPEKALQEFETTLSKEPRRFHALVGAARSAQLLGKVDASRTYFQQLLETCAKADSPGRPELEEAQVALERRRDQ